MGTEFGKRDPSVRRYLDAFQTLPPNPGRRVYDVEAIDDMTSWEQQAGIDAREDLVGFTPRCTPRKQDCQEPARVLIAISLV